MPEPAIVELTKSRMRECIREPEAVFWVFAFPMVLTLALGFAFRSKPPDRIPVAIVQGPHAAERAASLGKSPVLLTRVMSARAADEQLRTGKISILVEGDGEPVYRFDPTRPDARTARLEVDD